MDKNIALIIGRTTDSPALYKTRIGGTCAKFAVATGISMGRDPDSAPTALADCHSVTDRNRATCKLAGIPAGEITKGAFVILERPVQDAWHEKNGVKQTSATVKARDAPRTEAEHKGQEPETEIRRRRRRGNILRKRKSNHCQQNSFHNTNHLR